MFHANGIGGGLAENCSTGTGAYPGGRADDKEIPEEDVPEIPPGDYDGYKSPQPLKRESTEPSPLARTNKAVVLAHGWNSDAEIWIKGYMDLLCGSLNRVEENGGQKEGYVLVDRGRILANQYGRMYCSGEQWDIWYVDWRTGAGNWFSSVPSLPPWSAVTIARAVGTAVGATLWNKGYQHIHFVGHSAGSMVINSAKNWLRDNLEREQRPKIHLTFLDPYEPESQLLGKFKIGSQFYGLSTYGFGADWVDVYVDTEDSVMDLVGTEGASLVLMSAYNIDVTKADSARNRSAIEAHAWPYHFYKQTIDRYLGDSEVGVGFAFSAESDANPVPDDPYSLADLKTNRGKLCVLASSSLRDCDTDAIHKFENSLVPTTRERVFLANVSHVSGQCAAKGARRVATTGGVVGRFPLVACGAAKIVSSVGGYLVDSLVESELCNRSWLQALNPLKRNECFSVELASMSAHANAEQQKVNGHLAQLQASANQMVPGPAWGEYALTTDREVDSISFVYLHSGSPEGVLTLWVDNRMVVRIDFKDIPLNEAQHMVDVPLPEILPAGDHAVAIRLDGYDAAMEARVQVANINFGNLEPMEDSDGDGIGNDVDTCIDVSGNCEDSSADNTLVQDSEKGTTGSRPGGGGGGGTIGFVTLLLLMIGLLRRVQRPSNRLSFG